MRIKELFSVPEGQKITEKMFTRVLISSLCGIFLCMACLAGTTWAWFTVSIENTGNVIQIATVTADVSIEGDKGTASEDNNYELMAGQYTFEVKIKNDTTTWSCPVYVLMSVIDGENLAYYYLEFTEAGAPKEIEVNAGSSVKISFAVSWVKPEAIPVKESVTVGAVQTEETTTPTTAAEETAESTEASAETTDSTAATGGTEETADVTET